MNRHSLFAGATVALGLFAAAPALASSHREAPAIALDPAADNTDLWAWVNDTKHDKFYIVASYNPLEEPSGGPNFNQFSDDVLYEFKIARGPSSLAPVVTYQFRFKSTPVVRADPADLKAPLVNGKEFFIQLTGAKQTLDVWKIDERGNATRIGRDIPVAPPNIGPRTDTIINKAKYDNAFAATFLKDLDGGEGRIWAGPRDDGFYVDLGGVFDLANLRPKGMAQDGVAGFNAHTIAIEIPVTKLTTDGKPAAAKADDNNTLGVWATASRRQVSVRLRDGSDFHLGPWVQVSRLGLPLINEAVIGYQDKDKYNRTRPATDAANFAAYFLNPVIVRDAEAVGIYMALGADPTPFKSNRADIIDVINLKGSGHNIKSIGDVLRVDLGLDSRFPNGRPIPYGKQPNMEQADVTDVLLSVLLSKGMVAVSDNVQYNDANFLPDMPFLALPWSGYNQGHGKPTP